MAARLQKPSSLTLFLQEKTAAGRTVPRGSRLLWSSTCAHSTLHVQSKDWDGITELLGQPEFDKIEDNLLKLVNGPILNTDDKKTIGTRKRYGIAADVIYGVGGVKGAIENLDNPQVRGRERASERERERWATGVITLFKCASLYCIPPPPFHLVLLAPFPPCSSPAHISPHVSLVSSPDPTCSRARTDRELQVRNVQWQLRGCRGGGAKVPQQSQGFLE